MLIWLLLLIFLIPLILMFLNFLISKKSWLDREKLIPFECGFDSLSSSRLSFSIQFFLIAILFLLFDVEVTYFFPMIDLYMEMNISYWFYTSFLIILILYIGLEIEIDSGVLDWMN